MRCPNCKKDTFNVKDYKHNYDQGTLTDEYYSAGQCSACGKRYRVTLRSMEIS